MLRSHVAIAEQIWWHARLFRHCLLHAAAAAIFIAVIMVHKGDVEH